MQKYFFLCLFLLTLVSRESLGTPSEKKISDSLVRDLSCQGLSLGSLLGKIRPEAFSSRYHLPLRNWPFRSGAFPLAACWGMSSTQRKFFYLLRHGEKTAAVPPLPLVLDMIRGARPELADLDLRDDGPRKHIVEFPLTHYPVVSLPEDSLAQGFQDPSGQGLLSRLLAGVTESLGEFTVHRDFRSEVERSQERHFYRFRNVGLGTGSGPQSPKKNFKTLRQLQTNLKLHRLTLVDLRLKSTFQHVVIAKSFVQDAHGNVRFRVYDSNQPEQDQILFFHKASGHFYGPQILRSKEALGVFIVDEKEREDLEASLLSYYQNLCQN